ncbi:MAG: hypothetical protein OES69_14965 [Myxococcales bacterium]|nr:hypothetical protein [Myxococcales bacterium]MDH3845242.1 hypothetical protein [Myxococcales bacterium]
MIKLAPQTLLRISITVAVASCLLLGDGLRSGTHSASAQEVHVTGPLADKPAVMKLRLWRKNRLQLEPFFAFTFGDDYSRALIFGAEIRFSFLDWLGIGGWGGGSFVNLNTDLTRQVRDKGVTTNRNRLSLPSRENFPDQVGRMNWMAGVDAHFTPFRGKLAMFQKVFFDADLDFFVGAAFLGISERSDTSIQVAPDGTQFCDPPAMDTMCLGSQLARSKRVAIAPSFGVAFTAYFKEFMGLAIRWRAFPFKWNTGGTDEAGPDGNFPDGRIDSTDRQGQFNQMMSIGFIFVLPPKIKTTD